MQPIDYKRELQNFSYIVSHDLSAPLRHIRCFSDILMKKLQDKLTEDEQECFGYVTHNVIQIEQMIDALLEYSRLNTSPFYVEAFDCDELVGKIIFDRVDGDDFILSRKNLPKKFNADRLRCQRLFTALIDNACRFASNDRALEIEVSCKEEQKQYVFVVKDNGIGIDRSHLETIFHMYRKLSVDPEHLGVGLTMAKKIVEAHGGSIWAESDLDEGCSIFFTMEKLMALEDSCSISNAGESF